MSDQENGPVEEFEPEERRERYTEQPMRPFFTDEELGEMWLESRGPDEPPEDPETFADLVFRCLSEQRWYDAI